jgi:hypothetical protein
VLRRHRRGKGKMTASDDILDDLFHGCAWAAFLEICRQTGQFPPDCEATRRLAYALYEEALAEKNRHKSPSGGHSRRLRQEIRKGIDSGPATPMTQDDWDELKRRARDRATERRDP